jgi:1,4-alpha-glucan branching enzyme
VFLKKPIRDVHIMKMKNKHAAAQHQPAAQKVKIEYRNEKALAVSIAGTFNDWHPTATPMIALGAGRWAKELALPPGRYEYRLVVDGEWITDPASPEQAPNPHGSCNSVLVVGTKP